MPSRSLNRKRSRSASRARKIKQSVTAASDLNLRTPASVLMLPWHKRWLKHVGCSCLMSVSEEDLSFYRKYPILMGRILHHFLVTLINKVKQCSGTEILLVASLLLLLVMLYWTLHYQHCTGKTLANLLCSSYRDEAENLRMELHSTEMSIDKMRKQLQLMVPKDELHASLAKYKQLKELMNGMESHYVDLVSSLSVLKSDVRKGDERILELEKELGLCSEKTELVESGFRTCEDKLESVKKEHSAVLEKRVTELGLVKLFGNQSQELSERLNELKDALNHERQKTKELLLNRNLTSVCDNAAIGHSFRVSLNAIGTMLVFLFLLITAYSYKNWTRWEGRKEPIRVVRTSHQMAISETSTDEPFALADEDTGIVADESCNTMHLRPSKLVAGTHSQQEGKLSPASVTISSQGLSARNRKPHDQSGAKRWSPPSGVGIYGQSPISPRVSSR